MFQSICNAVTEGFKIILCLTDGEETVCSNLGELNLFRGKLNELGMVETELNPQDRILTFMKALLQIVPTNQIFLPAIVGLNMQPSTSKGLLPVYTIQAADPVSTISTRIRHAVIPLEAGGGLRSVRSAILQDRHYQNSDLSVRHIFKNGWLFFPPIQNMHCLSLLIAYRHEQYRKLWSSPSSGDGESNLSAKQILTRVVLNEQSWQAIHQQAWHSPTGTVGAEPEAKKGESVLADAKAKAKPSESVLADAKAKAKPTARGWYFRYSKAARPLAQYELAQTRPLALDVFRQTISDSMALETIKQAVVNYNWHKYATYQKKHQRKRKRNKNPSLRDQQPPLTQDDFQKLMGPLTPEIKILLQKMPKSCYPVSLPTYFWLIYPDPSTHLTFHDSCLLSIQV